MRRPALGMVTVAALGVWAGDRVDAQPAEGGVDVLHVRGPIYMIETGGTNVTASVGPDGVFLVDTGPEEQAADVRDAIGALQRDVGASQAVPPVGGAETRSATQALFVPPSPASAADIRYIVNTNPLPDHSGGNPQLAIVPREMSFQDPSEVATDVYAHENVLLRLSGVEGDDLAAPFESWPSNTYLTEYKFPYFNGEGIHAVHISRATTDGDSFVWFRGSDVISTGDFYRTDGYPVPHLERGGSIDGVIEGLNTLIDLALVEYRAEGGTLFVPGHGRISDRGDVAGYRDMVTIIRDRVQSMIDDGMTLEQIKAADPHRDYDGRYAKEPGAADRFTEVVYRSLTRSGDTGGR